ncbi:ABC transporter substrate-binding protein [Jiangella rhizosphaerae]|uniref:Probable sugar-binding periplasmic protein n=1 Tax=Jiangella rhizosphaerae TaxID=2293569 RepID=A0A418KS86_9ACTN|nr:ABC transporter substrate-binding protein [Jiangella rhizosphaerae]RIQ25237.1 carbohydrate ABC transporter substrate-binding protein [Jiangella rhizosphaerae]
MTSTLHRTSGRSLAALAAAAALVLASCGDDDGAEPGAGGTSPGAPTSTEFEFFSWWTGAGDSEGKQALLDLFAERHPDVEIIDATVAGGAGTNAQAVLTTRLQAGDPPDSYQRHVGAELQPDIEAELVEDLTWLYDEEGWRDVFPEDMLELATVDDRIYSVPVNIHRSNLIWYNPAVLAEAGIAAPPASWDEFLQQAATLEAAGKTPLTIGPSWTQKHLLENVLLGELGAEAYSGLWDGSTDWESTEVTDALDMFTEVLAHSNVDEAAADWQPALDPVIEGDAAYNVMGDWANTYFATAQGLAFETEYGVTTSPGTEGIFNWLSDSFTLPVGAPHRDLAVEWLRLAGSKEGQDTFNPIKGSIPARTDADTSLYTGYLEMPLTDWNDPEIELVGSLAHGVVAGGAFNTEIDSALGEFVASGDSAQFASAVKEAYEANQ